MTRRIAWDSDPYSMNNQCLNENCINKNKGYFYWDSNDINQIENYIQKYPPKPSTTRSEPIRRTPLSRRPLTRKIRSEPIRIRHQSRRTPRPPYPLPPPPPPPSLLPHPPPSKSRPISSPTSIMAGIGGTPPSGPKYLTRNIIAFLPDPTKNLKLEREFQIIKNYSQSSNIHIDLLKQPNATASNFFKEALTTCDTVIFCGHGDLVDGIHLSLAFENPDNNRKPIAINYSEFINHINNKEINLIIVLSCHSSNLFNFIHESGKNIITIDKEFITCDTLVESTHMRYFLQLFLYYLQSNNVKNSFIKSCNKIEKMLENKKKSFGDPSSYIMKKIIAPVIGIIRYTSKSETIIYTYTGQFIYDVGYSNIQSQSIEPLTTIFPPLPPYSKSPIFKAKSI